MRSDVPCVLDVSIAVKWFFVDEPQREQALAVRGQVAKRPVGFAVPHLFYTELIHVLMRKSGQDATFTLAAMALMERLGLRTLGLSQAALQRNVEWVAAGLTGYDATYVALAESLDGVWLTADVPAAKRAGRRAVLLSVS